MSGRCGQCRSLATRPPPSMSYPLVAALGSLSAGEALGYPP